MEEMKFEISFKENDYDTIFQIVSNMFNTLSDDYSDELWDEWLSDYEAQNTMPGGDTNHLYEMFMELGHKRMIKDMLKEKYNVERVNETIYMYKNKKSMVFYLTFKNKGDTLNA